MHASKKYLSRNGAQPWPKTTAVSVLTDNARCSRLKLIFTSRPPRNLLFYIWFARLLNSGINYEDMENNMKKTILVCALVITSTLMCSSRVMAQGVNMTGIQSDMLLSFEQLKNWIFSPRSSSTSRAKSLPAPDGLPLPTDPPCSTVPIEAHYGIPMCERPPVPPSPTNPNERQKPCVGRNCTGNPD